MTTVPNAPKSDVAFDHLCLFLDGTFRVVWIELNRAGMRAPPTSDRLVVVVYKHYQRYHTLSLASLTREKKERGEKDFVSNGGGFRQTCTY